MYVQGRGYRQRAAILQAMDAAGVEYRVLARRMQVEEAYLAGRLGGRGQLTCSELERFAEALGVDAGQLGGDVDELAAMDQACERSIAAWRVPVDGLAVR